jgi:hypothetical protein
MHPRAWTNTPEGRAAIGGVGPATKAAVRAALGLADGTCLVPIAEETPDAPAADPVREEAPAWTPSTT